MIELSITVDEKQINKIVNAFKKTMNFKVPLEFSGNRLIRSITQNFEKEQTSEGIPWKDLSKYTQAMRRKGKGEYGGGRYSNDYQVLSDTGMLKGSIEKNFSETELSVGTNKKYAEKMHFGDPNNTLNGRPAPVPARPFLGISALDETVINEFFKDYMKKVFYA